jgi:TolA-binding protein
MACAIVIFIWSVVQSRREGGRVTAREAAITNSDLARFNPPAYRGAPPKTREFASAIELYSDRDYAAAIPVLRSAADSHPDLVAARFYLGVCELYTNAPDAGLADLRKVIDAGETSFAEQARFYLAKGLIGAGNIAAAKEQLQDVIAMHGDMGQQAENLIAKLK